MYNYMHIYIYIITCIYITAVHSTCVSKLNDQFYTFCVISMNYCEFKLNILYYTFSFNNMFQIFHHI